MKRYIYNQILNLIPSKIRLLLSCFFCKISRNLLERSFLTSAEFKDNGEFWFLKNLPTNCKVVLDCGANRGEWTDAFLESNDTLGEIYLIDANPTLIDLLKSKYQNNPKVHVIHRGIDYRSDKISFHIPDIGDPHGTFTSNLLSPTRSNSIRTSTIDDLMEENNIQEIDFLKLDLEGFDYFALLGARKSIAMCKIGIIQFEITRCWEESGASPCAAFRFLNNSNYEIYLLKRDSLFKIRDIENITHFSLYSNFICIPKRFGDIWA